MNQNTFPATSPGRLEFFFAFFDARWEDLTRGSRVKTACRDVGAGSGIERTLRASMADRCASMVS